MSWKIVVHLVTPSLMFYMRKDQMRFHVLVCQEATCLSLGQSQVFVCLQDVCLVDKWAVIAKQSNRISSAIGKFYGKVPQEPTPKFQVLYLEIWHCLSALHLVLFSWIFLVVCSPVVLQLGCSFLLVKTPLAGLLRQFFVPL